MPPGSRSDATRAPARSPCSPTRCRHARDPRRPRGPRAARRRTRSSWKVRVATRPRPRSGCWRCCRRDCQAPGSGDVWTVVRLIVAIALALLLPVPAALAQSSNAPPGNSGIDQYLESVPSSSGDRPSTGGGEDKQGSSLPPRTSARLRALGKDGEAVDRLSATTRAKAKRRKLVAEGTGAAGRAPLPSVGRAISGSDGG